MTHPYLQKIADLEERQLFARLIQNPDYYATKPDSYPYYDGIIIKRKDNDAVVAFSIDGPGGGGGGSKMPDDFGGAGGGSGK